MVVEFFLLGAMTALIEPSSATKQCKALIGTKIETEPASKILTDVKGFSFSKGEFETSAEYEQRTQAFKKNVERELFLTIDMNEHYVIYDADSAQFLFGAWAFSKPDTLGKKWERRYGVDIGHLNEIAVRISEKEAVKGSYIGSNVFGVSAKVQEIEKYEIGIFERSGSFSDDEDLFGYGNGQKNILPDDVLPNGKGGRPVIRISASIEAAKLMKGTLAAAVLMKPKEPFYIRGTQYISPTIEGKRDITLISDILVADIKCVLIYDKQQKIIESVATQ